MEIELYNFKARNLVKKRKEAYFRVYIKICMKKTLFFFLLASFFLFYSCSKKTEYIAPQSLSDKVILNPESYQVTTKTGANGWARNYYDGGETLLESEGNYSNGNPSGYWKFWYADGTLKKEGDIANGVFSGHWKFWYESGRLQAEGNFSNGIPSGQWKSWHENGVLQSEGNYSNGHKNGQWRFYHYNGVKESEGHFAGSAKRGYWTYYNPQGKMIGRIYY